MSSLRQVFADTMIECARVNENLAVLVGDISHGILIPYSELYPNRYYNIGICEPSIVGIASGLAQVGIIPVAHTIAPFLIERSYEQIKLDFSYQKLSGNFITVGGAFDYGQLGCSHHCYNDVALMNMLDNSVVMVPSSEKEFRNLFFQNYNAGTINYFKLTENPHGHVFDEEIIVGKAIKIQSGDDLTLIAVGPQLKQAIEACEILEESDISVDLLYIHTIKPFDSEAVFKSIDKTRKAVVCEELNQYGGVYDLVLKSWAGKGSAQFHQLAISSMIHEYGSYYELCRVAGLTKENIVVACRNLCN